MAAFSSIGAFADEQILSFVESKGGYPPKVINIPDPARVLPEALANRLPSGNWIDIRRPLGSVVDVTNLFAAQHGSCSSSVNQSSDPWHALCQVRGATKNENAAKTADWAGWDLASQADRQVGACSKITIAAATAHKDSQTMQSWSSWLEVP